MGFFNDLRNTYQMCKNPKDEFEEAAVDYGKKVMDLGTRGTLVAVDAVLGTKIGAMYETGRDLASTGMNLGGMIGKMKDYTSATGEEKAQLKKDFYDTTKDFYGSFSTFASNVPIIGEFVDGVNVVSNVHTLYSSAKDYFSSKGQDSDTRSKLLAKVADSAVDTLGGMCESVVNSVGRSIPILRPLTKAVNEAGVMDVVTDTIKTGLSGYILNKEGKKIGKNNEPGGDATLTQNPVLDGSQPGREVGSTSDDDDSNTCSTHIPTEDDSIRDDYDPRYFNQEELNDSLKDVNNNPNQENVNSEDISVDEGDSQVDDENDGNYSENVGVNSKGESSGENKRGSSDDVENDAAEDDADAEDDVDAEDDDDADISGIDGPDDNGNIDDNIDQNVSNDHRNQALKDNQNDVNEIQENEVKDASDDKNVY